MTEVYKVPDVPAELAARLKALQDTAAEAEKKMLDARAQCKALTDEFYGLVGKLVVYREPQHRREMTYTLLVTALYVGRDGKLRHIGGCIQTKTDLKTGFRRTYGVEKRASIHDIVDSRVTVLDDDRA